MKKILTLFLVLTLCSFSAHKFYVSIFKIEHSPKKQRLEITTRIFIDDLNAALKKNYAVVTHLGEPNESTQDTQLMNRYLAEHFLVYVNGKKMPFQYVSHEYEDNVLIGYYKINGVAKVSSLKVQNSVLLEISDQQQNVIQSQFNGKKQSLLLTSETTSGMLK
ncbi:MAG: DUF6702 family protein [Flavobacteriaceae bacterium]